MQITIERTHLARAVAHVQSVTERRNTIPILANVLLEADQGKLRLSATDMDVSMVESVPCQVSVAGATTVPAGLLHEIMGKLPEGLEVSLALDAETNRLRLQAARSDFSLATLPREDFPVVATESMPTQFQIAGKDLAALIDKTRFAISKEGTRYYLTGIFLHAADQTLTAVATDGHRLAKVALPAPRGAEGLEGIIIPAKTVAEIRKLAEGDVSVDVGISPTKIQVAAGSIQLISKLIDGTYPDYQQVIPTGNDTTLIVDRDAFMAAVDRVSIVAADRTRAVKIGVQAGAVTLQANSAEAGTASEYVEGDYDGAPMEIGFNARYLLDILRELRGDTARFQLAETSKPTLVSDPTDSSALYVLMPMRV